jgi:excisionase family DNA binding protein
MELPGLLTKKQIAERYGVSPRTVTDLMHRRILPYYKMGWKLVRFDPVKCDIAISHYEHRSRYDRQITAQLNGDPMRPLVQPELDL